MKYPISILITKINNRSSLFFFFTKDEDVLLDFTKQIQHGKEILLIIKKLHAQKPQCAVTIR